MPEMLTIREIKARTERFLAGKGVPNPKLDADLLIAGSLGLRRLDLYMDMERPLTESQLDALRPWVKRRGEREPLQYITGWVEFGGLRLRCERGALIPRPETEELFETVCADMGESAPRRILDLGTGCGALALAFAKRYPDAAVTAIDASDTCLQLARANAEAALPGTPLRFFSGDWFDALPEEERFELIVANPPYLCERELETAEPEVRAYEPKHALTAGPDGTDDLRRRVAASPKYLAPGGLLALETGIEHEALLAPVVRSVGLTARFLPDLSGRQRFLLARLE